MGGRGASEDGNRKLYVREAEHDGGATLGGDEGAEGAARPVDLAQVLSIHHRGRHRRRRGVNPRDRRGAGRGRRVVCMGERSSTVVAAAAGMAGEEATR